MRKKISILLVFFLLVIVCSANCKANEKNNSDYEAPKLCDERRRVLDIKHMSPMYSADELLNIYNSLLGESMNTYCKPLQKDGKLFVDNLDIGTVYSFEYKLNKVLRDEYDKKFDIIYDKYGGNEIKVYLPKNWYTNVDVNNLENDTIAMTYKNYILAVQTAVNLLIFGSDTETDKPVVNLKVYNEDNHKELLTTAKFPQDGKVTQKLLMGKNSKIVKRSDNNSFVIDGVVALEKLDFEKISNSNIYYKDDIYKNSKGISAELSTYSGPDFTENYNYLGDREGINAFYSYSGVVEFNNKYDDISKSYKSLKTKFDKENQKKGLKLISTSKVKVDKYYIAYQNKYKMPNGEYKLEYNVLFNRDADQVTNKGELFSKLTISIQGNKKYLKEHKKEFLTVKQSMKLLK